MNTKTLILPPGGSFTSVYIERDDEGRIIEYEGRVTIIYEYQIDADQIIQHLHTQ